ncbi:related to C2C2-type Zn-finger protein [Cephalotrichum gorgonifer]|uniref:Related to C2C2-type Zn-finger protein n=1 Tax=Cephalotrichum gorgonifer TaxID=2041049 RepID=A0AAE8N0J7_9PEZI|nr:related to C2C2-type Zn-finger protein [Cephalotrichum gorgonifer]
MQGFNMGIYRPRDQDDNPPAAKRPKRSGPAPAPTVRFEMPYPIWCTTCPRPTVIGQGVRFNAEKRRVGSYFSTPIWSFRFRHADCAGQIEIQTDPKNTAYVVVSGARKRETGEDVAKEGDTVVMGDAEREALRQSAFAGLEKTIEDRERARGAADRVGELEDASARSWDDPYSRNQVLRRTFREERKRLERESRATEDLKDRMGLGIDLLPATETDALRASLVDFGASEDSERPDRALAKAMFAPPADAKSEPARSRSLSSREVGGRKLKSEILASKRKESLVSEIIGNTRLAQDPFLGSRRSADSPKQAARFVGVKRKQDPAHGDARSEKPEPAVAATGVSLVSYDSE